jgi:hypothetical protein
VQRLRRNELMSVPQIPHRLMSMVTQPGSGGAWVNLWNVTVSLAVIRAAVTSDMDGAFP